MPIQLKTFKNRTYVYADFRGLGSAKLLEQLDEAAKVVRAQPGKVLMLSDFTDAAVDPSVMSKLKALGKEVFQPKTEKQAVLGIDGLKKLLLAAYVKFVGGGGKPFDNEAAALDYLVST